MANLDYNRQVFINCPFDSRYQKLFEAIHFAVLDCGFRPRSAREADDGTEVRIEKLLAIIEACKFGIHDLSRTESDPKRGLPRFNMPFELGLFLGAKRYGNPTQRQKVGLILDRTRYRYQQFISDISGQDIHPHQGSAPKAIAAVRDWLRAASPETSIPGGVTIAKRFFRFSKQLPEMCAVLRLSRQHLTFADLTWATSNWLEENAW
jgi:hypothetical protein